MYNWASVITTLEHLTVIIAITFVYFGTKLGTPRVYPSTARLMEMVFSVARVGLWFVFLYCIGRRIIGGKALHLTSLGGFVSEFGSTFMIPQAYMVDQEEGLRLVGPRPRPQSLREASPQRWCANMCDTIYTRLRVVDPEVKGGWRGGESSWSACKRCVLESCINKTMIKTYHLVFTFVHSLLC